MAAAKTLEIKIERTIAALPEDVFDAWLSSDVPGTPWNAADKFILDARVDGLFYSRLRDTSHYGRFIKIDRAHSLKHTWVSPYTEGRESIVSVTFKKKGSGTLMALLHSGLPANAKGRAHKDGWTYFLDLFPGHFKSPIGR